MSITTIDEEHHGESTAETPLTDRVKKQAQQVLDAASEKAGEFERSARHGTERLSERVEGGSDEIAEALDQRLEEVEKYIREKPLKAAGIAFAAGILATLLLRR